MDREKLMAELGVEEDEFDSFYTVMLDSVCNYGTFGVSRMLRFIEEELDEDAGNKE